MIEKKYIEELNRIINSIKAGNDETTAFSAYLSELCGISDQSYSSISWSEQWRKSVYNFGRIFLKQDAGPYLKIVNGFLDRNVSCEIAAFFSSEIIWNYYEDASEYNRDAQKSYIKLFPHNPEFHNNYGIFLASEYNFDKSIDEHKVAIRLDDANGTFINNYTLTIKQYFEYLLKKNKVSDAEKLIKDAINFVDETKLKGIGKWEQISRLNSLRDRLNDFQIVLESVAEFKNDIEVKIRGEQKRLIEVLGIFSAIIAFILTNVTIAVTNLSTPEVLSLMFGMALVLMIFAVSISILFSPKGRYKKKFSFLKDNRFWTIIILNIVLVVWIFCNYTYSNEKKNLTVTKNTNDITNKSSQVDFSAEKQNSSTSTST